MRPVYVTFVVEDVSAHLGLQILYPSIRLFVVRGYFVKEGLSETQMLLFSNFLVKQC